MSDIKDIYAKVMAVLAALGFVVNLSAIVLLLRRKKKSMFHNLLKATYGLLASITEELQRAKIYMWNMITVFWILAVYDIFVLIGCLSLYSLPDLWPYFTLRIYPTILPWLLPVVQVAMMTSIYCTIVMSFERYIRICHLCQLKSSKSLTEDNFWCYVIGFLICPILFYLPKFFEITTEESTRSYEVKLNCTNLKLVDKYDDAQNYGYNSTQYKEFLEGLDSEKSQIVFPKQCLKFNFSSPNDTMIRKIKKTFKALEITPTALRKNKTYYKIYSIILNTLFAAVIPLLSLIYLNIRTVTALGKMGHNFEVQESLPRRLRSCSSDRQNTSLTDDNEDNRSPGQSRKRILMIRLDRASSSSVKVMNFLKKDSASKNKNRHVSNENSSSLKSQQGIEHISSYQDANFVNGKQELPSGFEENVPDSSFATRRRSQRNSQRKLCHNGGPRGGVLMCYRSKEEGNHPTQRLSSTTNSLMRRQENRLTRISLSIVSLFVACHIWRLIPTAYEAIYSDGTVLIDWPNWLLHIHHLSHTLIILNSAVNFLLYIVW